MTNQKGKKRKVQKNKRTKKQKDKKAKGQEKQKMSLIIIKYKYRWPPTQIASPCSPASQPGMDSQGLKFSIHMLSRQCLFCEPGVKIYNMCS